LRLPETRAPTGAERPFAPSLAHVSNDVLEAFFRKVSEPDFAVAHPRAAVRARQLMAEMGLGGQT
jgi:hypothetical protein